MENTTSRNSIILRNINSAYFEQAIFILKKGETCDEVFDDIISEAQKIVDNFIRRKQRQKRNNRIKNTLITIAFAIAVLTVLFYVI